MTFGSWLREKRNESGLSQRALADLLEIDHTYLSKIETSTMPAPGEQTLQRIASVLSMGTDLVYRKAGRVPQAITCAFAGGVTDEAYRRIMDALIAGETETE